MRLCGLTRPRVYRVALGAVVASLALGLGAAGASARTTSIATPPLMAVSGVQWTSTNLFASVSVAPGLDIHDESVRLGLVTLAAIRPTHTPAPPTPPSPPRPKWSLPVHVISLSARFGDRGAHWASRHTGLDFRAPRGTSALAVHDGVVIKLAWNKAYGRMVILQVSRGVTVWYCHLDSVSVRLGPVHAGQRVGRVGMSGNTTGPHLHLEVRVNGRPTNPWTYLFTYPRGNPGPVPYWASGASTNSVAHLTNLGSR